MSVAQTQLDHVAFAVPRIEGVVPLVVGELGGRERGVGPGGGFRFWQWEFAGGGALEILVPDGAPDGFLHRFLAARGGPAPHHLTFKVPDLREAMREAQALGYAVVGYDATFPSWMEAFLHPKSAHGIVVQLVESHPELSDWPDDGSFVFPAQPQEPPPPVELVGLRLAAKSEAQARRLWQELLGGSGTRDAEGLLFRWPESPLRVAVRIDEALREGPIALEIASDRQIRLPEGPHPALGLPIVRRELSR